MWIRSGQNRGCFLLRRCDFEEYQVALRLFFIVARSKSYLSLRDCVCLRGRLESDTVSMDWVKASLLKALLRRVSSLEVWDVGATTVFSWKTREYFKANLLAKAAPWPSCWTGYFMMYIQSWNRQQNLPAEPSLPRHELFSLPPLEGATGQCILPQPHKSSFSHRATPWPTPKSVQHCPCV